MHRPHGAAAGVLLAEARRDDVPDPAGAARRASGRRRGHGRRLPGPRRLSPTLRTRRRIHRGQAGPAEPAQPAAHRVGTGMEEPADLADAPAVTGRHRRVRAPHLGAPASRPRMTAGSAPRCSGVRMFPDMSPPVFCSDRSFPGIRTVPRIMPALKGEFMIPSIIIPGLWNVTACGKKGLS